MTTTARYVFEFPRDLLKEKEEKATHPEICREKIKQRGESGIQN